MTTIAQGLRILWGGRERPPVGGNWAAWTAACPRCKGDATWSSSQNAGPSSKLWYAIDCQTCGVKAWAA